MRVCLKVSQKWSVDFTWEWSRFLIGGSWHSPAINISYACLNLGFVSILVWKPL